MTQFDLTTEQPRLRITTTPNDANQKGDIFGGWLMSKMDIAGAIEGRKHAKGLVSTVAVKELLFIKPLFVYDIVSFYTELLKLGKSSVTVQIHVYATRSFDQDAQPEPIKVGEATFIYVAIERPGVKRVI